MFFCWSFSLLQRLITTKKKKTKMSKLETAMDTIVDVFQYYSSTEGDKFKLSRRELKNLLQGELSSYLQVPHLLSVQELNSLL